MVRSAVHDREILQTTLPNGLHVVSETMPHVRSVSVGIWVATGSRRETDEQNGITHFLEHMVFQGSERRSAEEIARSVDSVGGNLDAFTAKEMVSFNTKVLDEHLPRAFDVLADLVLHPLFREEDITKEKGVVLEELKMETDNPEYLVHELFCSHFWKDQSLGMPILGTRETVSGFSRTALAEYYHEVFAPSNLVITAAGNLRHEALLDLVIKEFGGLPRGAGAPENAEPTTNAHVQLRNKVSLEQVHLCIGVPSYRVNHELRYACYVLNLLLGGGMSSRLFQNIRERRGLAYSVFSELSLFHDTGCLLVSAGTSLESARQVVDLTLEEFRRFREEPVSEDELRRAKDQMKGSLMLSLESTASRMANLARQHLYFNRFFSLDELLASIEGVTAEEVQTVAGEFFRSDRLALTVLGALDGFRIEQSDLRC